MTDDRKSSTKKLSVLVSGGGTNLQAIIDEIDAGMIPNVEICQVIASNKGAYAIQRAEKKGIPVSVISRKTFSDSKAYDAAMLAALQEYHTDIVVTAGFLSLLGHEVLAAYPNRIINIHPSLIPSFCGKGMYGIKPHEAALQKGVKVSGATVHFLTEQYDEGPIILQKAIPVLEDDTPESLQIRIMETCEQKILPEAIRLVAGEKIRIQGNITRNCTEITC